MRARWWMSATAVGVVVAGGVGAAMVLRAPPERGVARAESAAGGEPATYAGRFDLCAKLDPTGLPTVIGPSWAPGAPKRSLQNSEEGARLAQSVCQFRYADPAGTTLTVIVSTETADSAEESRTKWADARDFYRAHPLDGVGDNPTATGDQPTTWTEAFWVEWAGEPKTRTLMWSIRHRNAHVKVVVDVETPGAVPDRSVLAAPMPTLVNQAFAAMPPR